jgi:peroxiredoxin
LVELTGTAAAGLAFIGIAGLSVGCGQRETRPHFRYTLLDGTQRDSAQLGDKVILVNFWATTCAICIAEMPHWVELHRQLQPAGRFEILAVAMSYDPPARVAHYAESRSLPFGVAIDITGAIARSFGDVRVTPSLFLLNPHGLVAHRYVGKVNPERVKRDALALVQSA